MGKNFVENVLNHTDVSTIVPAKSDSDVFLFTILK